MADCQSVREHNENKSSTGKICKLRKLMEQEKIGAYIIPIADDHQSETVSCPNRRLAYISGFTGSNGIAVITKKEAALWTDSRYYIQADKQLDSSWAVVKASEKESPSIEKWLCKTLSPGEKVGADPKKTSYTEWKTREKVLSEKNITLIPLEQNLVDKIWENKPNEPTDSIYVYNEKYAGESWICKIKKLREIMASIKCDMFVITTLDEIAWLFNLRGNDTKYTPVFYSYAIVSKSVVNIYAEPAKFSNAVKQYFEKKEIDVGLKPYESFWCDLESMEKRHHKILLPRSQNYSRGASYKIYTMVSSEKRMELPSPIINMRAYKNEIEANGMRRAHIKDAVALCQLMQMMEIQISQKISWDELKVSEKLDELRSMQELSMGPSFPSIVAYGKNGALPHYVPTNETNLQICTGPLTIDSGGQYLDGTIDTTRVLHFGEPTELEKKVYTHLLKGVADLASTVFPAGTTLQDLDFILRRPLYQLGMCYGHGSTHGTGVFLGVHESFNYTYDINFIGSQEPGYYKDDSFGMRLENLVIVVPASNIENHTNKKLLTFEPLTLVPYELNLIEPELLDKSQVNWINNYHEKVRNEVGPEMIKQKKFILHTWLMKKTNHLQGGTYKT